MLEIDAIFEGEQKEMNESVDSRTETAECIELKNCENEQKRDIKSIQMRRVTAEETEITNIFRLIINEIK